MSTKAEVLELINATITHNGAASITGEKLNSVLHEIVEFIDDYGPTFSEAVKVDKKSTGTALSIVGSAAGTSSDVEFDLNAINSVEATYASIALKVENGTTGNESGHLLFKTKKNGVKSTVGSFTPDGQLLLEVAPVNPKDAVRKQELDLKANLANIGGTLGTASNIVTVNNIIGGNLSVDSTPVGAIKIKFPTNSNTFYTIKGIIRSDNCLADFTISGLAADLSVSNPRAVISTTSTLDLSVRFFNDGTNRYISIGGLTQTWSYLTVVITSVTNSLTDATIANTANGWAISLITAFTGTQVAISAPADYKPLSNVANDLTPSTIVAPSATAVNAALALKANIAAGTGTLVALTFVSDSIQGTIATPLTGNITGVITDAQFGVVTLVIHNHTTEPTFDDKYRKLSSSGTYKTGFINYIFCEYINATEIIYSINQRT